MYASPGRWLGRVLSGGGENDIELTRQLTWDGCTAVRISPGPTREIHPDAPPAATNPVSVDSCPQFWSQCPDRQALGLSFELHSVRDAGEWRISCVATEGDVSHPWAPTLPFCDDAENTSCSETYCHTGFECVGWYAWCFMVRESLTFVTTIHATNDPPTAQPYSIVADPESPWTAGVGGVPNFRVHLVEDANDPDGAVEMSDWRVTSGPPGHPDPHSRRVGLIVAFAFTLRLR